MVADAPSVEVARALLAEHFAITVVPDRRMLSVPAPDEAVDLVKVSQLLVGSGVHLDEVALRRPTLDDAFLALTGHPVNPPSDSGADANIDTEGVLQ